MATDFLKMLRDQQEASKKETPKEVEQPQKVEKQAQSKDLTTKKDNKVNAALSFDEQFNKATSQAKAIVRYLIYKYPDIKEKMENPDVSIDGMEKYIQSQVRTNAKGGMFVTVPQELIDAFPDEAKREGYVSDNAVYGWGRHYYDECGKVTQ